MSIFAQFKFVFKNKKWIYVEIFIPHFLTSVVPVSPLT